MSVLSLVRGRAFMAPVLLAALLALAAACNGDGGDETPSAGVTPSGETPEAVETPAGETPVVGETATGETPTGETPAVGATTVTLQMVSGPAFSPGELRIAAGTDVEITAENTSGFHSFAVYESEEAASNGEDAVAATEPCSSPCSESVNVNLAAGEHFFRCEVHPNSMFGAIVAE